MICVSTIGDERSGQYDGLAGQIEALAAADVAAGGHIVDANHVRAGLAEAGLIVVVGAGLQAFLFAANHPADRVLVFFAAVRAPQFHFLGFLLFVVKPFVIHMYDSTPRGKALTGVIRERWAWRLLFPALADRKSQNECPRISTAESGWPGHRRCAGASLLEYGGRRHAAGRCLHLALRAGG